MYLTSMMKVLRRYQHIRSPTRGETTLDNVYTTFRQKLKRNRLVTRTISEVVRPIRLSCTGQLQNYGVSVVPTCFKETIVVPGLKKTKNVCLNDYRPVALTSTIILSG
ncbi:unnamed protein product [Pleuronectes platessa]|uniref:Uncharacterized protein n=1 Tax=Pleuronectes platessa TaxID=8262 RepID=A0A9N7UW50_PLEPL|nr:unnamed protein product [Pleuronectes platessa]